MAVFHLLAGAPCGDELLEVLVAVEGVVFQLGVGEVFRGADLECACDEARAEVQRLEALECLEQGVAGAAGAVVLKENSTVPFGKRLRDIVPKRLAAGNFIRSAADSSANRLRIWEDGCVGNLSCDGEADQCWWMGVDHGADVRTELVDVLVEGEFAGGPVGTENVALGGDAHDVLAAQISLVDTRWANPDVALVVENREIPAAGRCQTVSVDAAHHLHDLVAGMDEIHVLHLSRLFMGFCWKEPGAIVA